ncbi:MAG: cell division protein SepF [Candidatus Bathyarchaeia archaeon]
MPGLGGILRKPKKEEVKVEAKSGGKTYLKAMPLRDLSDLDNVKNEVRSGNILIIRITPLASKSVDDVKRAVNELSEFVESVGGDIARLGEERVVICPQNVRIWREKTPVSNEPIPTAA